MALLQEAEHLDSSDSSEEDDDTYIRSPAVKAQEPHASDLPLNPPQPSMAEKLRRMISNGTRNGLALPRVDRFALTYQPLAVNSTSLLRHQPCVALPLPWHR